MVLNLYLILLKNNMIKLLQIFIEYKVIVQMNAENFVFYFIKANIQNENDYIKFLLQFHKNNFEKNDI